MPTTYVLTDHDMATLDMVDALDSYTPKIRDMAYTCNKQWTVTGCDGMCTKLPSQ